ncbi:hypothetical protein QBC47DRAFT_367527 [Echria macrotheca]|uniref:FHA domain-containing protein n=1 Tax=Echria macrotheca TaxID=438768 RepID=A0AAJ0BLM8_9PEZI|nr:hypothetical protein QBC47DRAFT_367527 [Echria macrotheca]
MAEVDKSKSKVLICMSINEESSSDGGLLQRRLELSAQNPSVIIGRASKTASKGFVEKEDNGWLACPVVSRKHAEITAHVEQETVTIKDLGSLHGTYLNNETEKIPQNEPQELKDGDIIKFGATVWRDSEHFNPAKIAVGIQYVQKDSTPVATFRVPEGSEDGSDVEEVSDSSDIDLDPEAQDAQTTLTMPRCRFPPMPPMIDLTGDAEPSIAGPSIRRGITKFIEILSDSESDDPSGNEDDNESVDRRIPHTVTGPDLTAAPSTPYDGEYSEPEDGGFNAESSDAEDDEFRGMPDLVDQDEDLSLGSDGGMTPCSPQSPSSSESPYSPNSYHSDDSDDDSVEYGEWNSSSEPDEDINQFDGDRISEEAPSERGTSSIGRSLWPSQISISDEPPESPDVDEADPFWAPTTHRQVSLVTGTAGQDGIWPPLQRESGPQKKPDTRLPIEHFLNNDSSGGCSPNPDFEQPSAVAVGLPLPEPMPKSSGLAESMPSDAHGQFFDGKFFAKKPEPACVDFNPAHKAVHSAYLQATLPQSLGYPDRMPAYAPIPHSSISALRLEQMRLFQLSQSIQTSSMLKSSDHSCCSNGVSNSTTSNGAVSDEGRPESSSTAQVQVQVTDTTVDSDADKTSKKRKADDVSTVTGEETSWLEQQSRPVEASAPASPAPAPSAELDVPATEPTATSEPMTIDSEPQAVSAELTSDTCSAQTCVVTLSTSDERQPKRMRLLHIAERAGYVALGGVTAGAMIFGTLVYTAPSFV